MKVLLLKKNHTDSSQKMVYYKMSFLLFNLRLDGIVKQCRKKLIYNVGYWRFRNKIIMLYWWPGFGMRDTKKREYFNRR